MVKAALALLAAAPVAAINNNDLSLLNSTKVANVPIRMQRAVEVEAKSFEDLEYFLTGADEAGVQIQITVTEPIKFTNNLEILEAGASVMIKRPDDHKGYMMVDANGADAEYEEVRRHFFLQDSELTLVGLELKGGFRTGPQVPTHTGGSISVNGANARLTVLQCKFTDNHAHKNLVNNAYSGGGGGALYADTGGVIIMDQVVFAGNEAFSQNGGNSNPNRIGGGQDIFINNDESELIIRNSKFMGGGTGESGWARAAWVLESPPYNCLDEVLNQKVGCYGENSACIDGANNGASWGVQCECDAGYELDLVAQKCVKKSGLGGGL